MSKVRSSKKGHKFLREANLMDLMKAIKKHGGKGSFESNGKRYSYNLIGETRENNKQI